MNLDSNTRQRLESEALRIEEDANYSGRGHFQAAIPWSRAHISLGIVITLFSGVAGGLVLTWGTRFVLLAGIFALVAALLSGVNAFVNAGQRAAQHREVGNEYLALRNKARIYREIDLHGDSTGEELTNELKHLSDRRDDLNRRSPQIPGYAYKRAKRGIEEGQTDYGVDAPKTRS